jgi:hypothetical protein
VDPPLAEKDPDFTVQIIKINLQEKPAAAGPNDTTSHPVRMMEPVNGEQGNTGKFESYLASMDFL